MGSWKIEATDDVSEFIRRLPPKHAAKLRGAIARLAEFGPQLTFPDQSHIEGPFRELRTRFAGQQYRVIYARGGDTFYLLVAFHKTSERDLEKAMRRAHGIWPPD